MDINDVRAIIELDRFRNDTIVDRDCPKCNAMVTMIKVVKSPNDPEEFEKFEEFYKCLVCNSLFKEKLEQV